LIGIRCFRRGDEWLRGWRSDGSRRGLRCASLEIAEAGVGQGGDDHDGRDDQKNLFAAPAALGRIRTAKGKCWRRQVGGRGRGFRCFRFHVRFRRNFCGVSRGLSRGLNSGRCGLNCRYLASGRRRAGRSAAGHGGGKSWCRRFGYGLCGNRHWRKRCGPSRQRSRRRNVQRRMLSCGHGCRGRWNLYIQTNFGPVVFWLVTGDRLRSDGRACDRGFCRPCRSLCGRRSRTRSCSCDWSGRLCRRRRLRGNWFWC
jgi:hypothetical protein